MAKTPANTTALAVVPTNEPIELKTVKGHGWVTSQQVADHFGKRHGDVLRAIKDLGCSEEFSQRNFASAEFLDEQQKPRPMVEMTRDGFAILAMGFTGPAAMAWKEAYIKAFNQLEQAYIEQIQADAQKAIQAAQFGQMLLRTSAKEKQRHIDAGLATLDRIKKEADPHKRELLHCSLKHLYAVFGHPMPPLLELVPALPAPDASGPSRQELADSLEEVTNARNVLLEALNQLHTKACGLLINAGEHEASDRAMRPIVWGMEQKNGGAM